MRQPQPSAVQGSPLPSPDATNAVATLRIEAAVVQPTAERTVNIAPHISIHVARATANAEARPQATPHAHNNTSETSKRGAMKNTEISFLFLRDLFFFELFFVLFGRAGEVPVSLPGRTVQRERNVHHQELEYGGTLRLPHVCHSTRRQGGHFEHRGRWHTQRVAECSKGHAQAGRVSRCDRH